MAASATCSSRCASISNCSKRVAVAVLLLSLAIGAEKQEDAGGDFSKTVETNRS